MAAQLAATVYVRDPQTHQTVRLEPGTSPEPRLAALVKNPAAWVDRKLPRLPKTQTDSGSPTGDGQDDASGATSAADADQSTEDTTQAAPAAKKTAARKTAATGRSRGRDAAGEGTSGE
ncbi:hypothetical protein ACFYQT_40070 [Streptomyces tibetensis]|uniref:Uncharacterized protein n=1 Tax=Streptomyces tibetensis TaxID=2382123 RepID=A0ABW6N8G4_9ACTN